MITRAPRPRYFRLWIAFISASLARGLQFRADFAFRILMDVMYYVVNIGFFELVLRHTTRLGALDPMQARAFVASFLWMDSIYMTFFSSSLWLFPQFVNQGKFDGTLVRPVSPLFLTLFTDFSPGSFVNFLMASGILAWGMSGLSPAPSAWSIVALIVLLLLGVVLILGLRFLFLLPCFWITQVDAFRDLSWTLQQVGERPSGIYPKGLRLFFTYGLPILTAIALPAETFLEGLHLPGVATILGMTIAMWLVTLAVWRRGLRAYASASS